MPSVRSSMSKVAPEDVANKEVVEAEEEIKTDDEKSADINVRAYIPLQRVHTVALLPPACGRVGTAETQLGCSSADGRDGAFRPITARGAAARRVARAELPVSAGVGGGGELALQRTGQPPPLPPPIASDATTPPPLRGHPPPRPFAAGALSSCRRRPRVAANLATASGGQPRHNPTMGSHRPTLRRNLHAMPPIHCLTSHAALRPPSHPPHRYHTTGLLRELTDDFRSGLGDPAEVL